MAMSPQAVVFGIQSIMRLGNAAKRAYQDQKLDAGFTAPAIDTANLTTPERAVKIVRIAMQNDLLPREEWVESHDLVNRGDQSPSGLAAQTRVIDAAMRLDPVFAKDSELEGLAILTQWSAAANRQTPLGRIGIELADIAFDYLVANPALFGVEGNGAKLISSVAANLSDLLPDPDDPAAPGIDFASGAIRIFVEAGLRSVNNNIDSYLDAAHLRDVATSILNPLIAAVADSGTSNEPWYDLRNEFLGPISEAAIDALARNQVAILGKEFASDTKVGALTQAVLVSIKDNGLKDDFGKEGLVRIYSSMLDAVITRPGVFFSNAESEADRLVEQLLLKAARTLNDNSPPFDKPLGVALLATTFESVSANAGLLVRDIDSDKWTETVAQLSEVIVREIAEGLANGVRSGDFDPLQRLFSKAQAAEFLHIIIDNVATTPGLVVDDKSPEIRVLVEIISAAMAQQKGQLFSADNWLAITSIAAREVASNPGRIIDSGINDAKRQLLSKLMAAVMNAAAGAAEGGRDAGGLLVGPMLVEAVKAVIETAAGNSMKADKNVKKLESFVAGLAKFAKTNKKEVGRREWLYLFRRYLARVLDSGELPDLKPEALLSDLMGS